MTNSLATAELAIYALLALPIIYLIFSHTPAGLLGWFYLFAFTSLRVVGAAMSIKSTSGSASVISNIGLSPLLLAAGGILHEARIYRRIKNSKLEWTLVAFFHILVASGVGLVGAGASALQSKNGTGNDLNLLKIGISLLTAAWVILCVWTAASFLPGQSTATSRTHVFGTKLLLSVLVALPFIGIRVFYSLVAMTTHKAYLNPTDGSLSIRVLLSFLPELIATLVFLVAGLITRGGAALRRKELRGDTRAIHRLSTK